MPRASLEALVGGATPEAVARSGGGDATILRALAETDRLLTLQSEIPGLIRALDGRYIRPAPGGDIVRTPEVLPTGRRAECSAATRKPTCRPPSRWPRRWGGN